MDSLWLRESGPADAVSIVFLHGVGNTGAMWQRHMATLPTYHCLAPDLPGHGRSSAIRWSSRTDTAELVARIIESLPEGRAHVVGLSLGGSIALELLDRRPDLLDHAVVDGCAAIGTPLAPFMKVGVSLVSPFIRRPFVGRMVARGVGITDPAEAADLLDQLGQVDPRSFRRAFADAQDVRISETLAHVSVPTLLVAGEKELAHVRRSNQRLAQRMPHAASLVMPAAGHGWLVCGRMSTSPWCEPGSRADHCHPNSDPTRRDRPSSRRGLRRCPTALAPRETSHKEGSMPHLVIGGFIIVHGLITTMIGAGSITTPDGPSMRLPSWFDRWPGPFGRSWLFDTLGLGTGWMVLGGLVWLISGLLIVGAGLGYLDVPVVRDAWPLLALLGGALGLIAVTLFFHPLYLGAMVINLVLMVWAWDRANALT